MTKSRVIQIGLFISLLGLLSYKLLPSFGLNEITTRSISNFVLISIVLLWVITYIFRVVNGKMTFMEQRKRYRKEYEKIMDQQLKKKFDEMSYKDQQKLLKELEDN